MARLARGQYIDPGVIQTVHTVQRCVRRAFLCGDDPVSGQSFEHRRGWIRKRLEFLAGIFGIDCLTYAIMSNHLHQALRTRPDIVATWSDKEVALRWLRLFPKRRKKDGSPANPTEAEIATIVNDPEVLAERRRRLSDVSWWMRCVSETIARRANREDEVTGRFWEGRFKCQVLLDEASVLACAAYIDLNPIRAAIADTPEQSLFTGAKDRIDDLAERVNQKSLNTHGWERNRRRSKSGWMSPIEIDEQSDPIGPCPDYCGRRASLKGFLPISMLQYLELLDWTGRELINGKQGAIPTTLAPILSRIGLEGPSWCLLISRFSSVYKRAVGTSEHLAEEASRRGLQWMCAPGNPLNAA